VPPAFVAERVKVTVSERVAVLLPAAGRPDWGGRLALLVDSSMLVAPLTFHERLI